MFSFPLSRIYGSLPAFQWSRPGAAAPHSGSLHKPWTEFQLRCSADRKSFRERDEDPEGAMDGISSPPTFPEVSLKGLGQAGISRGFDIPKKPPRFVQWEGGNDGRCELGLGKSRKTAPKIPGFVPIPGKNTISTILPFSPPFLGWGRIRKSHGAAARIFLWRNDPLASPLPKISLQKSLGMTLNCSLPPETHPKNQGSAWIIPAGPKYLGMEFLEICGKQFSGIFPCRAGQDPGTIPRPHKNSRCL